jgi:hypothetical protein
LYPEAWAAWHEYELKLHAKALLDVLDVLDGPKD